MLDIEQFGLGDVKIEQSIPVYQGFFHMEKICLSHRLFAGGFSDVFEREILCRNPSVGVLLYDPVNQLIGLVEQFRIGALKEHSGPWLFEVVAGIIEQGTLNEEAALKEVVEESGITDVKLHPICEYLVSPGGTDEKVYLFCGITDLLNAAGLYGCEHEHEDIRFHVLPEQKVFAALQEGCFNNALTIIALLWLQLHKARFLSY